jgi:hypothetical protein
MRTIKIITGIINFLNLTNEYLWAIVFSGLAHWTSENFDPEPKKGRSLKVIWFFLDMEAIVLSQLIRP